MISKIARVFKTSIAINHPNCLFLADFHKATPFQGIAQRAINKKTHEFPNINSSIIKSWMLDIRYWILDIKNYHLISII